LKEIRSSKAKHVRIVPSYSPGRKASAHTEDAIAATGKWRLVLPFKFGEVRTGSGVGSDCFIEFTPKTFFGPEMQLPGPAPDEVLFHELVHASRMMRGVYRHSFINQDYTDYEDYVAVSIENIYLSDKGQQNLRGSHGGGKRLTGRMRDEFMNNSQGINL